MWGACAVYLGPPARCGPAPGSPTGGTTRVHRTWCPCAGARVCTAPPRRRLAACGDDLGPGPHAVAGGACSPWGPEVPIHLAAPPPLWGLGEEWTDMADAQGAFGERSSYCHHPPCPREGPHTDCQAPDRVPREAPFPAPAEAAGLAGQWAGDEPGVQEGLKPPLGHPSRGGPPSCVMGSRRPLHQVPGAGWEQVCSALGPGRLPHALPMLPNGQLRGQTPQEAARVPLVCGDRRTERASRVYSGKAGRPFPSPAAQSLPSAPSLRLRVGTSCQGTRGRASLWPVSHRRLRSSVPQGWPQTA